MVTDIVVVADIIVLQSSNIKLEYDLREVGVPSRNILHVRGRGSKSRNRVADLHRVAAAQKVS